MLASHEGLMLPYEEALTRRLPLPPSLQPPRTESPPEEGFYNTSAHFLWIGDRTRQIDGAHVEYFRGIRNPIGIKVGPSMEPNELVRLLASRSGCSFFALPYRFPVVNPENLKGKVALITRYGANKVP
jgi:3-deoxy-7-phosphoheptulonate synthase